MWRALWWSWTQHDFYCSPALNKKKSDTLYWQYTEAVYWGSLLRKFTEAIYWGEYTETVYWGSILRQWVYWGSILIILRQLTEAAYWGRILRQFTEAVYWGSLLRQYTVLAPCSSLYFLWSSAAPPREGATLSLPCYAPRALRVSQYRPRPLHPHESANFHDLAPAV